MNEQQPTHGALNTRRVPTKLLLAFREYCARKGYTQQGAVIALIREAVREDRNLANYRGPVR